LTALNDLTVDYSTRTIQLARNALTRALRHDPGARPRWQERLGAGRYAARPDRPSVQVDDSRAEPCAAGRCPEVPGDERVHRGEPPDRSAARGRPRDAVARRRPDRGRRLCAAGGPGRRRHQDAAIAPRAPVAETGA